MSSQKVAIFFLSMLPFFNATADENSSSLIVGGFSISIVSKAVKEEKVSESFKKKADQYFKEAGEEGTKYEVYRYSYTFKNTSKKKGEILIGDSDFIETPFNEIIQHFGCEIPSQTSRTISFLTIGEPKEKKSKIWAAYFSEKETKLKFNGVFTTPLYRPTGYTDYPYEVLENSSELLTPKMDN